MEAVAQRQLVRHACERCRAAGVRVGMTLAHARALLPPGSSPLALEARPDEDRRALDRLARWCIRLAPIVQAEPPDGLVLDVTGCDHLYGGETAMMRTIERRLARLGLTSRLACASTRRGARAVSRFGPETCTRVPPGDDVVAAAPLPVESLDLSAETIDALRDVAIMRVEHLLALPRASLARRFGAGLALRLDELRGSAFELIQPVRDEQPISVARSFEGPVVDLEAIRLAVDRLVESLCSGLREGERGARRIVLELDRLDAPPVRLRLSFTHPTRSARHLRALVTPRLERVQLGFGIEHVRLLAPDTRGLPHDQLLAGGDDDSPGDDRAFGELADALVDRLGTSRVVVPHPVDSHVPERQHRLVPALAGAPCRATPPGPHASPGDRPSRLHARPEPAEILAITPDGPPFWMRWNGLEHRIISSIGPERVEREWWRRPRERLAGAARVLSDAWRDYYRIQCESGRWLWIFRDGASARWFVHGEWA